MANTLTALTPKFWSKYMQQLRQKTLIARQLCNTSEQATLAKGDTVHRPRPIFLRANTYTTYTDTTAQVLNATDETLTVATTQQVAFDMDAVDKKQNMYDAVASGVTAAQYALNREIDGNILGEAVNAAQTLDAGNIGGTGLPSGTPITLAANNVIQTLAQSKALLANANVQDNGDLVAVVDPVHMAIMEQAYGTSTGLRTADDIIANGVNYRGVYQGIKFYESNNLTSTRQLLIGATNPTAGQTVTLKVGTTTVTFTFVAALTPTAGEVLIGASATATAANLNAAINNAAGAGTTYVALATETYTILSLYKVVSAVNGTTATTLDISSQGKTLISTTATTGSVGTANTSCLVMQKGAIDLVIQKDVNVKITPLTRQTGDAYLCWDLYGWKTFTQGADQMVKLSLAN